MKRLLSCLTLLALALPAYAQAVQWKPGELSVLEGRMGAVELEYDGDDVKWTVPAELDVFREFTTDPKTVKLRLIGDPGTYTLQAVACKDKKLSPFAPLKIVITPRVVPIPTPTPEPPTPTPTPPTPTPEPDDGARAAHVVAIICDETLTRTPAQAKVMFDTNVRANFIRDGIQVKQIEVSDPIFMKNGYKTFADKVGLPAVLVFDADRGTQAQIPLRYFKLPATAAEFDAGVRKAVRK